MNRIAIRRSPAAMAIGMRQIQQSRAKLNYQEIRSYYELAQKPALMAQLISTYQTIFGDPETWAEQYSDEDVRHKLQDELAGHSNLRICVDENAHSSVAAFFWSQLRSADDIVRAIATIKFSAQLATPELTQQLRDAIGEEPVIYIHDFGIQKKYRGKIWLTHLIGPVLWEIGQRTRVSKVLFWSVPGTQVDLFARREGFKPVLVAHGMHFHLGEFALDVACDGCNLPWLNRRHNSRGQTTVSQHKYL